MRAQQVNLYVAELRPRRELLSARQAVVLGLVFIAVLALLQIAWHLRAESLATELTARQAQVDQLQVEVDRLRALAPAASRHRFEETIGELQAAVAGRQQVRRIISGQNMGNARGFQQILVELAKASHGDLSLERFSISRGGSYVEMRGRTRRAGAIPLYLQRLKSAPVFEGARFGLLSISSELDDSPGYAFSLGYENLYRPAAGRRP